MSARGVPCGCGATKLAEAMRCAACLSRESDDARAARQAAVMAVAGCTGLTDAIGGLVARSGANRSAARRRVRRTILELVEAGRLARIGDRVFPPEWAAR